MPRPARQRTGRTTSRAMAVLALTVTASLLAVPSAFAADVEVDAGVIGAFLYIQLAGQSTVTEPASPEINTTYSVFTAPQENTIPSFSAPGALTTGEIHETITGPAPSVIDVSASIADVDIPNIFTADSVVAHCTARPNGTTGYVTLKNAKVGGVSVPDDPAPNTEITVPDLADVTLNQQSFAYGPGVVDLAGIFVDALAGFGGGFVEVGYMECGATGDTVGLPVGTLGGLLLTGALGAVFTVRQLRRRPA